MEQTNCEFNIASGLETRVELVADLIIGLAGKGKKAFYPAQKAQPQQVSLDISVLAALGYAPKIGIEEGLKRTFEWYERYFAQPAIVI